MTHFQFLEMCGACSTNAKKRATYLVLVGKFEGKKHLEDLGVDGRIILKFIFKKWDKGVDGFDMAQDRDKWRDQ